MHPDTEKLINLGTQYRPISEAPQGEDALLAKYGFKAPNLHQVDKTERAAVNRRYEEELALAIEYERNAQYLALRVDSVFLMKNPLVWRRDPATRTVYRPNPVFYCKLDEKKGDKRKGKKEDL